MVQSMELDKGGRGAIERMVEAYGFTTRQALCEKLGVSKSTLATRYMRDSFPSDWVIQCALETGASLRWLTTGNGLIFENLRTDITEIRTKKVIDGQLFDAGTHYFDKAFTDISFKEPIFLIDGHNKYVAEQKIDQIVDGLWLVSIDGEVSVRSVYRLPNNIVRVESERLSFESNINDIGFILQLHIMIKRLS